MQAKTLKATALALAFTMTAATLPAAMDIAPPVKVTWNGFIHTWSSIGENAKYEYVNAGVMLKRLRFRMGVEPYDGVTVVILPELAGAFTLLDGYVKIDLDKYLLDFTLPISVTAGQFKTPFGLNRMYLPGQLPVVDYSSIYNGPTGVVETTSFWDQGVMLTSPLSTWGKLDVAWIEGLGPNQATPGGNGFGTKQMQDFAARLDLTKLWPGLTVGGSAYHGESYKAAGTAGFPVNTKDNPKLWTGAHFKYATFGKGFSLEGEFLNRTLEKLGVNVAVTQYVSEKWQLAFSYDHVTAYLNDKVDQTRYLGGVNYLPGGPLRLSLNQLGTAVGSSQKPANTRTILQCQVVW